MSDLRVIVDETELTAEWAEENPETRAEIERSLPIEGEATRWGEELYFKSDIDVPAEAARASVAPGRWPTGRRETRSVCSGGRRPRVRTMSRVRPHR